MAIKDSYFNDKNFDLHLHGVRATQIYFHQILLPNIYEIPVII